MAKRAGEELFDELHALLTYELVARIKSGEASTADLRAAIDWLSKNDITGVACYWLSPGVSCRSDPRAHL